jgi:pimeloyl-ACP methyl ester carboxylesterase
MQKVLKNFNANFNRTAYPSLQTNKMTKQFFLHLKMFMLLLSIADQLYGQTFTTLSADSVPIVYEVHGKGTPALVFVHGWSCDRSYWKAQIKAFAEHYRVVALDLAGHGASGTVRKEYSIESFGADVAAVVNKLNLYQVVLIGHSMGGDVIAAAARLLPRNRMAGLVMVDTYHELGEGRSPLQVQAFVAKLRSHFADSVLSFVRRLFIPSSDSALVEWVATDMASAPPRIALSAVEYSFNYSRQIAKTLQELRMPVVALNADYHPTDTVSMKRYGVDVVIVPGLGHFLMMENPERFNQVLEEVLKKFTR